MDTDLHSEHTPHTELSLSATQTLLTITHRASCYGHSHKREQSLGIWHYFLFSLSRATRVWEQHFLTVSDFNNTC